MFDKFFDTLARARSTWKRRIVIQLILMFVAIGFEKISLPLATDLPLANGLSESQQGSLSIVCWFALILCYRCFFYDRYAACAGLIAGIVWLIFGDLLVMPFWIGLTGLIVHLARNIRDIHAAWVCWYIFVTLLAWESYSDLYPLGQGLTIYLFILATALVFFGVKSLWQRKQKSRQAYIAYMEAEERTKEKQRAAKQKKAFDNAIAELRRWKDLPAPVQPVVMKIVTSTENILHCMKNDSRDVEPGQQFLDRYLPLVLSLVQKGKVLAIHANDNEKNQSMLDEQLNALERLSSAFEQQHQRLLENDTDDLNAEMDLLDKLLKTDGFSK